MEKLLPTVEEVRANQILRKYTWISAGVAVIPIPLLDLAALIGVQLKMLDEFADLYRTAAAGSSGKRIVASLLGGVWPATAVNGLFGSLVKAVPFVGGILGAISFPIFAGASTFAVGKVFIQHFESGGTFLDFKPAEVKEYFLEQFDAGKLLVAQMKADTKPSASVPNPVRAGASTTA